MGICSIRTRRRCTTNNRDCGIYPYNHHVRLLSPEPLVVDKPQSTRVEEPTLLCNHVFFAWILLLRYRVYQAYADQSPHVAVSASGWPCSISANSMFLRYRLNLSDSTETCLSNRSRLWRLAPCRWLAFVEQNNAADEVERGHQANYHCNNGCLRPELPSSKDSRPRQRTMN